MVSVRMIRSRPAVAALGLVIGGMMWTVETGRSNRDVETGRRDGRNGTESNKAAAANLTAPSASVARQRLG
jgi:hypothetical protein